VLTARDLIPKEKVVTTPIVAMKLSGPKDRIWTNSGKLRHTEGASLDEGESLRLSTEHGDYFLVLCFFWLLLPQTSENQTGKRGE
jgi:hypothetical protein